VLSEERRIIVITGDIRSVRESEEGLLLLLLGIMPSN
jgi:hypothetical protein